MKLLRNLPVFLIEMKKTARSKLELTVDQAALKILGALPKQFLKTNFADVKFTILLHS